MVKTGKTKTNKFKRDTLSNFPSMFEKMAVEFFASEKKQINQRRRINQNNANEKRKSTRTRVSKFFKRT